MYNSLDYIIVYACLFLLLKQMQIKKTNKATIQAGAKMEAYLDNSATTKPCKESIEYMLKAVGELWGNPSSLHEKGIEAMELLESARETLAKSLGCKKSEVIFTSGGTQGNNIALFGAANAKKRLGKKVITSSVEHPSVSKVFDRLEADGFEVVRLSVDKFGKIDLNELEQSLDQNTILVSVMAVNNELGTIEPIKEAAKIVKSKSSALFHTDCVQAFGKIKLNFKNLGADLLTVSSHKIHGPKGVGALVVKEGIRLVSPSVGGGQEKDIRPGTEPMPAIAGFMGAVKQLNEAASLEKAEENKRFLLSRLEKLDSVVINSPSDSLPYIVNISLPGYRSETILNFLSDSSVYVSSGSACAKGHKSPVLTAAGLDSKLIDSSLRISMSRFTQKEELEYFTQTLQKAMSVIRKK